MKQHEEPIGFFDSGVGGISVLKKAVRLLPNENFIYYGDSLNAPYGSRPAREIQDLTLKAVELLLAKNIKALVLACNTATSAAAEMVRQRYPDLPVLGIEPALKPAVFAAPEGAIVVMATETTLKERKFADLVERVAGDRQVIPMSCPGLVELIEGGQGKSEETRLYLEEKFKPLAMDEVSAVVLGCTHYPFIRPVLRSVIGAKAFILDGADGISRHLQFVLEQRGLLTKRATPGEILMLNSAPDKGLLDLSVKLLIARDQETDSLADFLNDIPYDPT